MLVYFKFKSVLVLYFLIQLSSCQNVLGQNYNSFRDSILSTNNIVYAPQGIAPIQGVVVVDTLIKTHLVVFNPLGTKVLDTDNYMFNGQPLNNQQIQLLLNNNFVQGVYIYQIINDVTNKVFANTITIY